MKMQKKFLIILPLLSFSITVFAQKLQDSTIKKIDSLFKQWDNYNSPGCAIGIVRNDSLIYSKGYGMANLEYGVRITPETIFHMASISKQFTAYSIVLLSKQGKLQLDDDVHKYLSWLPDFKEKITIRNLLNHTSGIRDQWQLLAISGTRLDDVITQDHIVKILSHQKELNFKPGAEYMYSNSGFTMLAEIVKSVSGQSLRKFTDSAIFKPLGMVNTNFHDDYTEIVPNRSYSYDRIDSTHFSNSILSYSVAGATSLFTNINDMSKWVINFYNPKVGEQKDIQQLAQKGNLNNNKEIDYALGISVGTHKGWKEFSHGGADAGYRTYITVFPDLKMGFLVFSNLGDLGPWDKAYNIADLFINDTIKKTISAPPKKIDSSIAVIHDTTSYQKYTGNYISDEGIQFSYKIENQKFYWVSYGNKYLLTKSDKDTFSMIEDSTVKFVFEITSSKKIVNEFWPGNERLLTKYDSLSESVKQFQLYTGTYYCPELDCNYQMIIKDNSLMLTNSKYNDSKITWAGKDDILTDYWWMNHLKILRNNKNEVIGFEVNSGRVMHLRFNKIK